MKPSERSHLAPRKRDTPSREEERKEAMRIRRVAGRNSCSTFKKVSCLDKLVCVVHSMSMKLQSELLVLLQVESKILERIQRVISVDDATNSAKNTVEAEQFPSPPMHSPSELRTPICYYAHTVAAEPCSSSRQQRSAYAGVQCNLQRLWGAVPPRPPEIWHPEMS